MRIGGMNRRMGARIGSVISCRKITTGLRVSMPTQRSMIRMKTATINMTARIWMKRPAISMSHPSLDLAVWLLAPFCQVRVDRAVYRKETKVKVRLIEGQCAHPEARPLAAHRPVDTRLAQAHKPAPSCCTDRLT
jgi:hypothetical protein